MVFKKGHKPLNKKVVAAKKQSTDVSDFYVKFGVKSEMKNNLSNLSYLISTLKHDLEMVNNFRAKKAYLRKELYETLISLRLNIDNLERHMPSKEFEALKNKIAEISKYAKKEIVAKKPEIKPKPIIEKKAEEPKKIEASKPKPIIEKKAQEYEGASDKEKRELEMLKKDLEDISNQLRSK
jgi:hypothetical protein